MEDRPQVSLTIDGQEVSAPEGATILEAARGQGIAIPTLCHHAALTPWGGCRLCVVEVDGAPRLAAACVMPVRKGMEVVTDNPRITQARRTVLEFLFAERAHYCMYCARSGDCELQALAYAHGLDHLTVPSLDQVFPVDATHPFIALDHNRCVLCGRCVRACREIAGVRTLDFQYRGGANTIGADMDGPLGRSSCVSCGACLQVCPTGAIFHRDRTHQAILGKDRDWHTVESFCPRCEQHCPTANLVRGDSLLKIEAPLPSPIAWQGQLCRKGRFEPFGETHPRLLKPMLRKGDGWQEATWEEALAGAAQGLAQGRSSLLGLISSDCGNEEVSAFLGLM
ncbi:MAG: ferredoxin, partial [Desulfovibrio sp.]|nr:ferredoxin [Desulfovibrio sp.]